jgi:regulator of extracellular matrix RemA (YlzA/DUF370 family)
LKLINIGFGNMVSAERIIAIAGQESAPIKRVIQLARESGNLIDATYGRKTKSVIIMDSGHIVLSALQPETLAQRAVQSGLEKERGSREPTVGQALELTEEEETEAEK